MQFRIKTARIFILLLREPKFKCIMDWHRIEHPPPPLIHRKVMLYQWAMEVIQILSLRSYLKMPALSYFCRFLLIFLEHFLHFKTSFKLSKKFFGHMVAPVHKNTNALLILKIRYIHFCQRGANYIIGHFWDISRGPRPLKGTVAWDGF